MQDKIEIGYELYSSQVKEIEFKQGNKNTSEIQMTIYDNGVFADITGETIEYRFKKQDETDVFQDTEHGVSIIDAKNGIVTCVLMPEVLQYVGIVQCEVHRKLDDKELTTPTFSFNVKASIGEGALSGNYISSIENKMTEWQGKVDAMLARGVGATYDDTAVKELISSNTVQLEKTVSQEDFNNETVTINDSVTIAPIIQTKFDLIDEQLANILAQLKTT